MGTDVEVSWSNDGADFLRGQYSRHHEWRFDGGLVVPASASPLVVRAPYSVPENIDPEEAFVASISSCHMLWFLDYARRAGFVVKSYHDAVRGKMEKNAEGKVWVSMVTLSPVVEWEGEAPSHEEIKNIHEKAHDACFIGNSVKSEIVINV